MPIVEDLPALNIDQEKVRIQAGYPRNTPVPVPLESVFQSVHAVATSLLEPKASYEDYGIETRDSRKVLFSTGDTVISPSLAKHLKAATQVTVCAVTVGNAVRQHIDILASDSEITRSYLLDAYASVAVESVIELLNQRLIRERKGCYTSVRRFSPGYGDFALEYQPLILKLSGAAGIGMSCNELFYLFPEKSITALIGWAPIKNTDKL